MIYMTIHCDLRTVSCKCHGGGGEFDLKTRRRCGEGEKTTGTSTYGRQLTGGSVSSRNLGVESSSDYCLRTTLCGTHAIVGK